MPRHGNLFSPGISKNVQFSLALELWTSFFLEGMHSFVEILCSAQEAIHSSFHSDASAQRNLHRCMQGLLPNAEGQR